MLSVVNKKNKNLNMFLHRNIFLCHPVFLPQLPHLALLPQSVDPHRVLFRALQSLLYSALFVHSKKATKLNLNIFYKNCVAN